MPEVMYHSIPEYLDALRQLVAEGLKISAWEDKPALLTGFTNGERRICVALSVVRSYYRISRDASEPYDAAIQRWKDDIQRTLRMATVEPFVVGSRVVSRMVSRMAGFKHHGRVVAIREDEIAIEHDADCCEPDLTSMCSGSTAHIQWRVVIVRTTAWERILADD